MCHKCTLRERSRRIVYLSFVYYSCTNRKKYGCTKNNRATSSYREAAMSVLRESIRIWRNIPCIVQHIEGNIIDTQHKFFLSALRRPYIKFVSLNTCVHIHILMENRDSLLSRIKTEHNFEFTLVRKLFHHSLIHKLYQLSSLFCHSYYLGFQMVYSGLFFHPLW